MKSTEIKCKPNIETFSSYMQSCVEENVEKTKVVSPTVYKLSNL